MYFRLQPAYLKIGGLCCSALLWSQLGFAVPKNKKPAPQPSAPPVQQAPAIPQPPPTPEQMPAVPPQVSWSHGMLSITAENSTLGDILNAVRKQTGATLEIPPVAANERVAARLGPDNPSDVLQDLLRGSKFDYIIVGSPQDSNAVQKIILTVRTGGGQAPPPAMAANQVPYQPPPPDDYQPPSDVNDSSDEEAQPEPASPEQQPPPPVQPNNAQPNAHQPKTPEQLLQELQQMQQQQQQHPPRNPQ